jgi:hypothetical protein
MGRSLAVCAALLVWSAIGLAPAFINHDVAWYLHVVNVWFHGGVLYQDVIDTNPPLIIFLTAVPVLGASFLSVSATAAMKGLVLVLAACSAFASASIAGRLAVGIASQLIVGAALVFLLVPFAAADFGQREHFAAILVMPYALASAAAAAGNPLRRSHELVLGLVAGAGFALKPHFLLAWVLIELTMLWIQRPGARWIRPSAVGVAAFLLVYLAVIVVFVPQYFVIAREVVAVYGGLNESAAVLARLPDLRVWVAATLALALVRLPTAAFRACLVVLALATGFLLAAMLQFKGWPYHLFPFRVFVSMFFVVALVSVIESRPALVARVPGGAHIVAAIIVVLVVAQTARALREANNPPGGDRIRSLDAVVRRERAGSLAMLSMRWLVAPAFPVANYTSARWVLRHHSLWFLPGLYARELAAGMGKPAFHSLQAMNGLERRYFEQVVSDLCRNPPQLLGIDTAGQREDPQQRSIDLIAYYQQDDRFANLFAGYGTLDTVGPFTLYVRGDTSADPCATTR